MHTYSSVYLRLILAKFHDISQNLKTQMDANSMLIEEKYIAKSYPANMSIHFTFHPIQLFQFSNEFILTHLSDLLDTSRLDAKIQQMISQANACASLTHNSQKTLSSITDIKNLKSQHSTKQIIKTDVLLQGVIKKQKTLIQDIELMINSNMELLRSSHANIEHSIEEYQYNSEDTSQSERKYQFVQNTNNKLHENIVYLNDIFLQVKLSLQEDLNKTIALDEKINITLEFA
jgi:hypothetical protein